MVTQSAATKRGNNSTSSNNNKTTTMKAQGPSEAMIQLIAPDGYYTYLGIPKPSPSEIAATESETQSKIDDDLIKKNYRKLSLKHHPDKPGGDADTFRLLHRAQKVLSQPKLRRQYDLLGLDLDDDDDEDDNNTAGNNTQDEEEQTTSQGIVHEVATMAMAGILHLGVRTLLACLASTLFVRYRLLLFPCLCFMGYMGYNFWTAAKLPDNHPNKSSMLNLLIPGCFVCGLVSMYYGRNDEGNWTWLFWIGESLVIAMLTFTSVASAPSVPLGPPVLAVIGIFAMLAALYFRGKFWNYFIVLAFELAMILFTVMAFPVMEMVLEAILNEKLRKVGDKVRAHQKQMEAYYANKT